MSRIFFSGLFALLMLMAGSAAADELHIVCEEGHELALDECIEAWQTLYPDSKVHIQEMETDAYYAFLRDPAAMASSQADVLLVRSNLCDLDMLMAEQLIVPVTSAALREQMAAMLPQLSAYLVRGEQLYGFPAWLMPGFVTVRPELLASYELGGIPETLDEYIAQLALWYEKGYHTDPQISFEGNDDPRYMLDDVATMILIQYLHACAQEEIPVFHTPEMARMLERLSFLTAIPDQPEADQPYVRGVYRGMAFSPMLEWTNADPGEVIQFILPPAFDAEQQQVVNAYLQFFVVSSHAADVEAAEAFIACCNQTMAEHDRLELYTDAQTTEDSRYTEEMVQAYREMATHLDFTQGENIGWLFNRLDPMQILSGYYDGHLTVEEALRALDEAVKTAQSMP